jgi:hypothetical protein
LPAFSFADGRAAQSAKARLNAVNTATLNHLSGLRNHS